MDAQPDYNIVKAKAPYIGLFSGEKKDRLKFADDHTNRFAIGLFKTAEEGGRNSVKIGELDLYADISSIVNRIGISREEVLSLAKGDGKALLNRIRESISEYGKIKEFVNDFFKKEVGLQKIINRIPEIYINPKLEQSYLILKNSTTSDEINNLFAFINDLRLVIGDKKYSSIFEDIFSDFFDKKLTFEGLLKSIEQKLLIENPEIIKIKKDLISKINDKNEIIAKEYLYEVFQKLKSFNKNESFQNKITEIQENLFQSMNFDLIVKEKIGNIKDKNIKKLSTNLINNAKRSPGDLERHLDRFFKELYFLEPKLFSNKVKTNRQVIIDKNKIKNKMIIEKNKKFLNLIVQKISYVKKLSFVGFDKESKLQIDENHSYTFAEFIMNLSSQVKSLSIYKKKPDFKVDVDYILLDLNNLIQLEATVDDFKHIINRLNIMLGKYKLL